jgi:hypothetical protein
LTAVGEFRKTLQPQNVKFYEIHEISFHESRTCEPPKSRTCGDLKPRTCEAQESWTCEDLESWTYEAPKSRTCEDLKPWTCEARSRELVKIWNLEPVKTRSHEPAKFGNLLKFEFGSHDVWRFPGWGDSRISGKPSQRRRLKKSGFGVWTGGSLVNVWDVKDIHVHVHTRNIPWVRRVFSECKSPFASL